MKHNISHSEFITVFVPIFLGFIFFRLMIQTDIFMLAPFGSSYLAAFSLPSKIMLLDFLVAFSIGPISSIYLAQAQSKFEQAKIVKFIIIISLVISFIIMLAGFIIYPIILKNILTNEEIIKHALIIIFWLTVAIPARLLTFIQSMMLHGIGLGKIVVIIDAVALMLNIIFNYLLIKIFGASGIFIATCLVSILTSLAFGVFLSRKLDINWLSLAGFDLNLLKNFFTHSRQEFSRLCFYFGHGFFLIFILGRLGNDQATIILSAFSVSSELCQMIIMIYIAVMRSAAIIISKYSAGNQNIFSLFRRQIFILVLISFFINLILFLSNNILAQKIYQLDTQAIIWWNNYIFYFALSLPIMSINSFLRSVMQSKKLFSLMQKTEFMCRWLAGLPIISLGLYYSSPQITWSWLFISELGEFLYYFYWLYIKPKIAHQNLLRRLLPFDKPRHDAQKN